MRHLFRLILIVALLCPALSFAQPKSLPKFRMQEIDKTLTVGYCVILPDLNGDGKPDIVVADSRRVIWFENPAWTMHTILAGQTVPDNVSIDAIDITGDGKPDLVLGAGWKGYDTKAESTLQWLARGANVNEPWTMHPFGKEVDIHRIHVADIEGSGKPQIYVAPLLGKGATKDKNWMDATPRFLEFVVPADPMNGTWEPKVVTNALHVMHNFTPIHWKGEKQLSFLAASYEGVNLIQHNADGSWKLTQICAGNQDDPKASRGTSEMKLGKGPGGQPFIAAIEPWHGNQVVVYTAPKSGDGLWDRHVLDDTFREGHALHVADFDGDSVDEILIGSRGKDDAAKITPTVNLYKLAGADLTKWDKHVLDGGGVAAEDIQIGDLNGDGKIDIVAVGRATHNVRIYWNE